MSKVMVLAKIKDSKEMRGRQGSTASKELVGKPGDGKGL
jgi:hypothetical protein